MANIYQEQIRPDVPKSLSENRIFVYVPKGTFDQAGILRPAYSDFALNGDILYSKQTKVFVSNVLTREIRFSSDPQTQITDNANDIENLKNRATGLEGRMSQAELDIDVLENYVPDGTNSTDNKLVNQVGLKVETDRAKAVENQLRTDVNKNADDIDIVEGKINTIESKIPNQASSSNQLADKEFVNSSINNIAAYYITSTAAGDAFPTKSALDNATTVYSGGQVRVPTRNDYCVVREDETQNNSTTRYTYQNGQWEFQYIVNESPLTAEQLAAINSGITQEFVSQITTNKNDIATISNKIDSSATAADRVMRKSYIDSETAKKADKSRSSAVLLSKNNWSNNTYVLDLSSNPFNKTLNDDVTVSYWNGEQNTTDIAVYNNNMSVALANIYRVVDNGTTISLVCKNVPTEDLYINVEVSQ